MKLWASLIDGVIDARENGTEISKLLRPLWRMEDITSTKPNEK